MSDGVDSPNPEGARPMPASTSPSAQGGWRPWHSLAVLLLLFAALLVVPLSVRVSPQDERRDEIADLKKQLEQEKRRADDLQRRVEQMLYVQQLSLAQHAMADNKAAQALDFLQDCQWDLRGWEFQYLLPHLKAK
jgi:hypothetical protein